MSTLHTTFTRHYQKWREGDSEAHEDLIRLVYGELCRMARFYLWQESNAASIEPEMLANDTVVQLLGAPTTDWNNRRHFFLVAANRMKKLLIDHARKCSVQKRIPYTALLPLQELNDVFAENTPDLMELNEALEEFQKVDLRAYQIVMLRFFFGLTEAEVAKVLEIPLSAVKTDWKMAKHWLYLHLPREQGH